MITPIASGSPAATAATLPNARTEATDDALTGVSRSFREALGRVERSERFVDRAVRRMAHGGHDPTAGELLAVQTQVYRASQQAELLSRAVDRTSDTVREITQIRV